MFFYFSNVKTDIKFFLTFAADTGLVTNRVFRRYSYKLSKVPSFVESLQKLNRAASEKFYCSPGSAHRILWKLVGNTKLFCNRCKMRLPRNIKFDKIRFLKRWLLRRYFFPRLERFGFLNIGECHSCIYFWKYISFKLQRKGEPVMVIRIWFVICILRLLWFRAVEKVTISSVTLFYLVLMNFCQSIFISGHKKRRTSLATGQPFRL